MAKEGDALDKLLEVGGRNWIEPTAEMVGIHLPAGCWVIIGLAVMFLAWAVAYGLK